MSTIKSPHVVFSNKHHFHNNQPHIVCLNCDCSLLIDLPMEVHEFCRKAKGFELMHRDCKKKGV